MPKHCRKLKNRSIRSIRSGGLLLFYLAITLSPVLGLAWTAIRDRRSGRLNLPALFTPRRFALLGTTLELAAAVAALGMLAGTLAAFWLWQHPQGIGRAWRWLILLFILVPPFVHAQSWIFAIDTLNRLLTPLGIGSVDLNGFGAAVWVQLMAFLPMAIILALAGFLSADGQAAEAALLDAPAGLVAPLIVLPQALTHVLAGGSLLFILSLTDYGIPSIFRLNVYSLDLFAEYSAANEPGRPFFLALPYLAAIFLILAGTQGWLTRAGWRGSALDQTVPRLRLSAAPEWLLVGAGLLVSFGQVMIPLFNLLLQTGSPLAFILAVSDSLAEIRHTVLVALLAVALALPTALAAALSLDRHTRTGAMRLRWLFIALPAALPASLTGIGAVAAWNQPWLDPLYGTLCAPALVAVSRFAPFAAIILAAGLRGIDPDLRDIVRLHGRLTVTALARAFLPLLLPSLLTAGCLVFALTAGELGATLIVCPPGKATLTLKIYNYLHYGATGTVAALCLFMTLLALVSGSLAILFLTSGKETWHDHQDPPRRA